MTGPDVLSLWEEFLRGNEEAKNQLHDAYLDSGNEYMAEQVKCFRVGFDCPGRQSSIHLELHPEDISLVANMTTDISVDTPFSELACIRTNPRSDGVTVVHIFVDKIKDDPAIVLNYGGDGLPPLRVEIHNEMEEAYQVDDAYDVVFESP